MRPHRSAIALALSALVALPAAAQENCTYQPLVGALSVAESFDGVEACRAACAATDGCRYWSWTPHRVAPTLGAAQCRLMDSIAERRRDQQSHCGEINS